MGSLRETKLLIKELSKQVLEQFKSLVRVAENISIQLPSDQLEFPIDLLECNGSPLFLQKPIYFQTKQQVGTALYAEMPRSAFIVSDVTADPQRAARDIASMVKRAKYLDIKETGLSELQYEGEAELLLVSAHGFVGQQSTDYILIADGAAATSSSFMHLNPKIVYFDSCRLGVSKQFIDFFESQGSQ